VIRVIATVTPIVRATSNRGGARAIHSGNVTCEHLGEFRCDVCGAQMTGPWSATVGSHDQSHVERESSYVNLYDWFEPVTKTIQ
jgi:hypothetical protein